MLPLLITVYLTELRLLLFHHISMSTTASFLDGRFIKKKANIGQFSEIDLQTFFSFGI